MWTADCALLCFALIASIPAKPTNSPNDIGRSIELQEDEQHTSLLHAHPDGVFHGSLDNFVKLLNMGGIPPPPTGTIPYYEQYNPYELRAEAATSRHQHRDHGGRQRERRARSHHAHCEGRGAVKLETESAPPVTDGEQQSKYATTRKHGAFDPRDGTSHQRGTSHKLTTDRKLKSKRFDSHTTCKREKIEQQKTTRQFSRPSRSQGISKFRRIWFKKVPDPTKLTGESLANELMRVRIILGPITGLYRDSLQFVETLVPAERLSAFHEHLKRVSDMYARITDRRKQTAVQRNEQPDLNPLQRRKEALEEAIAAVQANIANGSSSSSSSLKRKFTSTPTMNKVLAGQAFEHYLTTYGKTDLDSVGMDSLRHHGRTFCGYGTFPRGFEGSRGDLERALVEYIKEKRPSVPPNALRDLNLHANYLDWKGAESQPCTNEGE